MLQKLSVTDGNCLYSSLSLLLVGDDSLVDEIRLYTSIELFLYSEYYEPLCNWRWALQEKQIGNFNESRKNQCIDNCKKYGGSSLVDSVPANEGCWCKRKVELSHSHKIQNCSIVNPYIDEYTWIYVLSVNGCLLNLKQDQNFKEESDLFPKYYWIGLEKLYRLTNEKQMVLRVEYVKENDFHQKVILDYIGFRILDNTTWKFTFTEFRPILADPDSTPHLFYKRNIPFSNCDGGIFWESCAETESRGGVTITWGSETVKHIKALLRVKDQCEEIVGNYSFNRDLRTHHKVNVENGVIYGAHVGPKNKLRGPIDGLIINETKEYCSGVLIFPDVGNYTLRFVYNFSDCNVESQDHTNDYWPKDFCGQLLPDRCKQFARCWITKGCRENITYLGLQGLSCDCYDGETCLTTNGEIRNLALQGSAEASSLKYTGYGYRAIDGMYSLVPNVASGIYVHTELQSNPWVSVNLKYIGKIFKIRVINDNTNFKYRLDPFNIILGNKSDEFRICRKDVFGNKIDIHVFCINGIEIAKWVKVQTIKFDYMLLQEIQVYGYYLI